MNTGNESIGPIARIWRGRVPRERADAYLDLMEREAIPAYRSTPGNRAAMALRRDEGNVSEVTMVSTWDTLDAIRAFAGNPVERARYFDFDADFLLDFPATATHYRLYEGSLE